jgi:hypothetical protein
MRRFKSALSLIICACMLGAVPGLDCSLAAAVIQTQVQAVPVNAGIGAAGASLTNSSGITAAPAIGLTASSLSGMLGANSPVPQLKSEIVAAAMQAPAPAAVGSPVVRQPEVFGAVAAPMASEPVSPVASPIVNAGQTVIRTGSSQAGGIARTLPQAEQTQTRGGLVWHAMSQLQQLLLSFGKSKGSQEGSYPEASRLPLAAPGAANPTAAAASSDNRPMDLVVMFGQSARPLAMDAHLSLVDLSRPDAVSFYARTQQRMLSQIASAGLEADAMASFNATPVATYSRINAATIRVEAGRAAEFRKLLESRGFKVYDNTRRRIVEPVPVKPENMDPLARGPIGLEENLKITKADSVQARAQKAWGAPGLGAVGRFMLKVLAVEIPQPAIGVIDTGADLNHPLLKRVKALVNATSGPNKDENGHGSWVTSMILNYAPWLKSLTHYKVFTGDGGATLDDILKALTMAGNDGNLVISNSWGDDQGDPEGPDAQLVRKLAQEGHIMVFAAGNSGPGANTIGAPAIVQYKDAKTGAIRVISVAAADRSKKIAYFSSRGPGSPKTANDPDYKDHRPDLSAPGYNTDGAWPTDKESEADRVDPVLGPIKSISGTSMATPAVAGAIALLAQVFGVTSIGEKLDAVVNGVMSSLVKTGQSADAEGQGFIDLDAAFKAISQVMTPVVPSLAARIVLGFAARSQSRQARLQDAAAIPEDAVWEYRALGYTPLHIEDQYQRQWLDPSIPRGFAKENRDQAYSRFYAERGEFLKKYPELPLRVSLLGRLQLALGGGR